MSNSPARIIRFFSSTWPQALLFLVGLATAALAIHEATRQTRDVLYADDRTKKLALFDQWGGRINSPVFGTSRIADVFVPQIFDKTFADGPYRIQSLNMGVDGGSQTEQRYLARRIFAQFAQSRQNACLMVLELNAGLNFPPQNLSRSRAINIYDTGMLRFVFGYDQSVTLGSRIGRDGFASLVWLQNLLNFGMVSSYIFQPHLGDLVAQVIDPQDLRGLHINQQLPQEALIVDRAFRERPAKPVIEPASFIPGNRQLLLDISAARADPLSKDTQFVYVITPTLEDMQTAYDYPAEIDGPYGPVPVINLARPDRYPEVYQVRYWRNAGHPSLEGAKVLSDLLGREIRDWLTHHNAKKCG